MINKIKRLSIMLIILFVAVSMFCPSTSTVFAEDVKLDTSAKAMAIIESNSGRLMASKNVEEKCAMASTTKIATAITVLKTNPNLDEIITIKNSSTKVDGTRLYLKPGENITVRDLLYGLMLISGNDCALALAERFGGDVSLFAEMMTKNAKDVGAINTNFKNPHGLDEQDHYTTALDLAKITVDALKNETFKNICSTKSYTISDKTQGGTRRLIRNKNRLLSSLDGCVGVKTGFTSDAGRCLVSAVDSDKDLQFVCVVLNCGPMFPESAQMLSYLAENVKMYELLSPYQIIKEVDVEGGVKPSVKAFTMRSFSYPLTKEEFVTLDYDYNIMPYLKAPIKKEQIIGSVKIRLNNELLFEEKVYTMEDVKIIELSKGLKDIIHNFY